MHELFHSAGLSIQKSAVYCDTKEQFKPSQPPQPVSTSLYLLLSVSTSLCQDSCHQPWNGLFFIVATLVLGITNVDKSHHKKTKHSFSNTLILCSTYWSRLIKMSCIYYRITFQYERSLGLIFYVTAHSKNLGLTRSRISLNLVISEPLSLVKHTALILVLAFKCNLYALSSVCLPLARSST